jgi:hypothetical protein
MDVLILFALVIFPILILVIIVVNSGTKRPNLSSRKEEIVNTQREESDSDIEPKSVLNDDMGAMMNGGMGLDWDGGHQYKMSDDD